MKDKHACDEIITLKASDRKVDRRKLTVAENVQYEHIMHKVKKAKRKGNKYIFFLRRIKNSVKDRLLNEGLEIYYYERKPISLICW